MHSIILFDIDGTLVTTGGAGRRALERVFGERFGRKDVFKDFPFAGMTDLAIVREGLKRCGREFSPEESAALLKAYVVILEDELRDSVEHRLHHGMKDIVETLRQMSHVAIGLGTGNVVEGAKAKLAPLGVYEHFAFGGFGSDHEDRAELIRIGAERGAAKLGRPRAECRLVIIGDTPKDIKAAHDNDGECLAVATGSFSINELRSYGADFVCADLRDEGARRFLLGA